LDQEGYLALSKKLKESITIPKNYQAPSAPVRTTVAGLQKEFISANPKLSEDGIAVYCSDSGRYLKEVFFCHSLRGEPAACSQEVLKRADKSCGQPDLLVRNVK
jgi:ribonuclease T2